MVCMRVFKTETEKQTAVNAGPYGITATLRASAVKTAVLITTERSAMNLCDLHREAGAVREQPSRYPTKQKCTSTSVRKRKL